MFQPVNLKKVERSARRAFQQDGLTEALLGIFLAATAGWIHDDGLFIPWLLLIFFLTPVLEGIRRRFTYPRIGYAKLIEERPSSILRGIALYTIFVLAATAITLSFFGDLSDGSLWGLWRKWAPTLAGVLLAGGFIYLASLSGAKRYHVMALSAVGLGIAFSLAFPQTYTGVKIYLLTVGGVLFLYGVTTFVIFLRRCSGPQREVYDGAD